MGQFFPRFVEQSFKVANHELDRLAFHPVPDFHLEIEDWFWATPKGAMIQKRDGRIEQPKIRIRLWCFNGDLIEVRLIWRKFGIHFSSGGELRGPLLYPLPRK